MVGRAFKKLLPNATLVDSKMYDLRNQLDTNYLFLHEKPTHVIHLAAKVGGVKANSENLGSFYYDNIMINTNVLEAARKYKVRKVVSFLSTCIFPADIDYPLTEKKIHLGPPHPSNYGYAYAKRMLEVQTRTYREQYGVNYVSVIPTNIYGPHDNFDLENGHVLPALIHKCYLAKQNKEDFVVWGDGTSLREFVYSEDIAKLTKWVVENYDEEEPIIFSTSHEVSIRELVSIIVRAFNFDGNVVFDTTKPAGQHRKPADNSKLLSYLPGFEFTPIEIGVAKTIDWFINNYEDIRK